MPRGTLVRRTRRGTFEVRLPEYGRWLLGSLLPQLRTLLTEGDTSAPQLRRLFPAAYPDDPERDQEFRRLVREDLVAGRLAAITELEGTLDARELTRDQVMAWMGAVNSVRLVLGTMLDVTEQMDLSHLDADHPDLPAYASYDFLSYLLDELVTAVS
ncbi:MAG TPA: DUF2017 family protein [Acidimicrobiales bacterium]